MFRTLNAKTYNTPNHILSPNNGVKAFLPISSEMKCTIMPPQRPNWDFVFIFPYNNETCPTTRSLSTSLFSEDEEEGGSWMDSRFYLSHRESVGRIMSAHTKAHINPPGTSSLSEWRRWGREGGWDPCEHTHTQEFRWGWVTQSPRRKNGSFFSDKDDLTLRLHVFYSGLTIGFYEILQTDIILFLNSYYCVSVN